MARSRRPRALCISGLACLAPLVAGCGFDVRTLLRDDAPAASVADRATPPTTPVASSPAPVFAPAPVAPAPVAPAPVAPASVAPASVAPASVVAPAPVAPASLAPASAAPASATSIVPTPEVVPTPAFATLVTTLTRDLDTAGGSTRWSERAWASYRAGDHATARRYFAKLADDEPWAWKHAHNLACSSAKAGEPDDARIALEESLRRGGEAAVTKAKREADFADLRGTTWFDAVLDGTAVSPLPRGVVEQALSPGATVIPTTLAPPAELALGLTTIPGSFDPFRTLLRATTEVSGGKRTAYGPRKPPRDAVASTSPAWTPKRGRRHLASPAWWHPDAAHTYLVVPFDLAGFDSTFGATVRIHGYAIYVIADGGARLVHGIELDPRGRSCGDGDDIRELFFDASAQVLFDTEGCQGGESPDDIQVCAVRIANGTLSSGCNQRPSDRRVGPSAL